MDPSSAPFNSLSPPPSPSIGSDDGQQEHAGANFFSRAQDFRITGGEFTAKTYVNKTIANGKAVFELLKPYTCLGATKDSSARHPPPRCHPGTRATIRGNLMRWLVHEPDPYRMLWVRGFAGTGKSAVAQSFADSCEEKGVLGGVYFFFRAAGITQPNTLVPTLVYQLAANVSDYRSYIEPLLAKNPLLLDNSSPIQFRKLIVEPFTALQRKHPQRPIAVILDGFDECEGEAAQREILSMITDAVRRYPNLPLRWLIFSRPEAHLKNAFTRNPECGREELIIDAECRDNVEQYVKDSLIDIKATYTDITPANWPPQAELEKLVDAVSGLFALAATCIHYIADAEQADPVSQLDALWGISHRLEAVSSRNPLATLDLLYSQILEDVSPSVFGTTWQILAFLFVPGQAGFRYGLRSAQALANFLRLDQRAFYKAVRGLHSVMRIPNSEDAAKSPLQFYHKSFLDFLQNPIRSGKFAIDRHKAQVCILSFCIHWYDINVVHSHEDHGDLDNWDHRSGISRGLLWASDESCWSLSLSILHFITWSVFNQSSDLKRDKMDESILSQVVHLDFRYWRSEPVYHLVRLCLLDPSTHIVRVEPSSSTDYRLLDYFRRVIKSAEAKPATFPLPQFPPRSKSREYFFIGHGDKSVIVWITYSRRSGFFTFSLCSDEEPSDDQIFRYEELL